MSPKRIDRPSPNQDERKPGLGVDMLVLHYTGMKSATAALERMCDATAEVSAHYMIDEDGTTYQLVPEERRAWHAGVSSWRGLRDINARSIGIELVNPGHEHGYRPFPETQMAALETLAGEIVARHGIEPRNVVAHSDIAPQRKEDPGELFDWARLARAGIGLYPFADGGERSAPSRMPIPMIQRWLRIVGYEVESGWVLDPPTIRVITAFQRHFRPASVEGLPDHDTILRLESLVRLWE
ncbi:MAG: N-acetylmuramoyl-L-alanine amidase [Alphaproteobacteria bacterium]